MASRGGRAEVESKKKLLVLQSRLIATSKALEANREELRCLNQMVAVQADSPKYLLLQFIRALNARIMRIINETRRRPYHNSNEVLDSLDSTDLIIYDLNNLYQYRYSRIRNEGLVYVIAMNAHRALVKAGKVVVIRPLRKLRGLFRRAT